MAAEYELRELFDMEDDHASNAHELQRALAESAALQHQEQQHRQAAGSQELETAIFESMQAQQQHHLRQREMGAMEEEELRRALLQSEQQQTMYCGTRSQEEEWIDRALRESQQEVPNPHGYEVVVLYEIVQYRGGRRSDGVKLQVYWCVLNYQGMHPHVANDAAGKSPMAFMQGSGMSHITSYYIRGLALLIVYIVYSI